MVNFNDLNKTPPKAQPIAAKQSSPEIGELQDKIRELRSELKMRSEMIKGLEMKLVEAQKNPAADLPLDEIKIAVNVYVAARSKRCYKAKNGAEKFVVNKLKKWVDQYGINSGQT